MSEKKKQIRKQFRETVFERDDHRCVTCGYNKVEDLSAHHITDRNEMPDGGYVPENGITLCDTLCHTFAERAWPGFTPDDLYKLIGSSKEEAEKASRLRILNELTELSQEMGLYDERPPRTSSEDSDETL